MSNKKEVKIGKNGFAISNEETDLVYFYKKKKKLEKRLSKFQNKINKNEIIRTINNLADSAINTLSKSYEKVKTSLDDENPMNFNSYEKMVNINPIKIQQFVFRNGDDYKKFENKTKNNEITKQIITALEIYKEEMKYPEILELISVITNKKKEDSSFQFPTKYLKLISNYKKIKSEINEVSSIIYHKKTCK